MNAPTLIVGLGGKGSDIVLRVSKMVTEEQRQQIGFAVFDTDVNELKQIKEQNPFVRTIQTSTKLSVGEYLDIDTHSRDTWFPVNAILNSKTLTEGAGQVRAISRLAFETAVRAGMMEELHKAIEDLYKLEGSEYQQALRVIIVSSLAGGTGSGLILPVALYIKNYLKTHFRQGANITRGFFLLPEVFYGVIPGQAERNNLKCNAYATLRELDAFLMKGDATLPEKYNDSVKIEFPNVSSNEYEQYDVRPYDFCFLFDAQNADGKKLNSFNQYLDHAASCIYAQSIGPMNKRSNSSEDNTIRKLCEERGRNRYAGAGTSMLIYPFEDVKEYLALNWAKECVSDKWMVFDREYKKRKKDIAAMRREGVRVHDITADKNYIDTVNQMALNKDGFAVAIRDSCGVFDEDGFERYGDTWETYIDALKKKIEFDNSNGNVSLDSARDSVNQKLQELGEYEKTNEPWRDYQDAYQLLIRYRSLVVKNSEEIAHTTAYTLFKGENDTILTDKFDYQLETYLRDTQRRFVHPNAARYFLYNTADIMRKELVMVDKQCEDAMEFFNNFEDRYFDDEGTEDVKETVNDLNKTKKIRFMDKLRKRLSEDQEELIDGYNQYLSHINEYRVNSVMKEVLREAIEYAEKMSNAFEIFFTSFDAKVEAISRRIREIEKKYDYIKGTATRYVCASSKCLTTMSEEMPYTGSYISINEKLSMKIYQKVREYAMLQNKIDNAEYFSDVFDKDIIGYFKDSLMESYGMLVDMDIIDAIEKEAEYEHGIIREEEKRLYLKHVFDESKVLAAPFIEKPLGEEKNPIYSCAYNNKLNPRDDSSRSHMIDSELKNFGGEEDADIPKNMVLFYKSFYGLRATDLGKFAPPSYGETSNRSAGEYFKAYYELISKVHPVTHKTKVITPHINKWWHCCSMMPDLDDGNQQAQENQIYAAFLWGLIGDYIGYEDCGHEKNVYKLRLENLNIDASDEDGTLVVSNGTPCDRLYEVLDSFEIYPELVERVLDKIDRIVKKHVDDGTKFEDLPINSWLNDFYVTEFPLAGTATRSIFELPLLMKKSVPTDIYNESDTINIIKVELSELKKLASNFFKEKDFADGYSAIIMAQFDRFVQNIDAAADGKAEFYAEPLISRICSIIENSFEELDLTVEQQKVASERRRFHRIAHA